MLLGMLVGIGVLVEAAGGRLAATLSSLPGRRRR
jgi:hypothetical protein